MKQKEQGEGKEKQKNQLQRERNKIKEQIGEIRRKTFRINYDKIAQALDTEYNKKIRKEEEKIKRRDMEGKTEELKRRQQQCARLELEQEKREIWKKMEQEIIRQVEGGDDLMIWKLEREGIKIEKEKIEKQEQKKEELKMKASEIRKQIEKPKGPMVMMANVCSISGITEQTKIRKQVIRDFISKEQPDVMGLVETNIQEERYELKAIEDYQIYQTKPNKEKES